MLTTEQVKKIAKYMELIPTDYIDYSFWILNDNGGKSHVFNPRNDTDNHKVFKALVDECKKREWQIIITVKGFSVEDVRGPIGLEYYGNKEFNNESICLAYLAVMESK